MLDLDRYRRDGFLLVEQLLDEPLTAALAAERLRFDPRGELAVQVQLVNRSRLIREFVTTGPQVALAEEVLGPNVCFTHQQYVTKGANDGAAATDVPWHQDSGYGQLDPPTDLTVWIALDDTDIDNGCLWVIRGSHRAGLVPHGTRGRLLAADVEETGEAVPMARGDALLFSGLLLHRSSPNRTPKARAAMYVRYCTPDVVMVSHGSKPVLEDAFSWMVAGEA